MRRLDHDSGFQYRSLLGVLWRLSRHLSRIMLHIWQPDSYLVFLRQDSSQVSQLRPFSTHLAKHHKGALYYLSTWYKRGETSLRVTLFFFGQMFASATSQLIAAGLLSLSGKQGLAGWQWLWLIDGLITIAIGIAFILFIPPSVGDGNPLISFGRFSYFTERESHILVNRVLLDDPQKARGKIHISGKDILSTIIRPRIWVHIIISMVHIAALQGLGTYTPSIIKSLGFPTVRANAMASVGTYAGIVFVATLSYFRYVLQMMDKQLLRMDADMM